MWKQMWIFWLTGMCLLGSGVRAEDGPNFFPTAVGMTWIYGGNPREIALTARIADVERTADGEVFFWEGFQRRRVVRQTADGKVMELEGGTWRLLFDLGAKEGVSWTIEPFGMGDLLDGARAEVVSRSAEVRVPYATFQGALHLKLISPNLADAGVTEVWFADGIGLVKWVEQSIAGPQAYELATFTKGLEPPVIGPVDPPVVVDPMPYEPPVVILPGEPEPIPDPVRPIETYENRASVELNGVRYEFGVLQSSYTQEDEMEMQYRVTALDRDVVFQFTSTQQFDFLLVDEQDTKVWIWSATRGFGDALTSLTLRQGESRGFVTALRLENEILPPGNYRLIGFLPTSAFEGETVSSDQTEVSVHVEIVGDPVRARVFGEVVDESGKPVAGAIVSLGQQAPPTPDPTAVVSASVARTDRNGGFVLNGVVPGEYVVTVSKKGYHPATQTISVTPGFFQMRMEVRVRVPDGFENVHAQRHDRFLVELATDRESYAAGDSVRVQYRLVNTSGGSVRLMFPSGQRYDLALDGPQGRVWQWSATRSFIQVLSAQVLDAEETFEFTEVFSLSEIGAGSGDSFLLRGFLSVAPDEDGSARPSETEGLVKFAVGSQVGGGLPQSGPDGRVAIEVALDQDGYSVEGSVQVTYRLTNISEEVLRLTFPSGQRYDLVLEGNEGPFWGWSRTRLFVAEISEQTLAPKESFEFQEVIPLTEVAVQDGGYALKVFLAVRSDSEMGLTQDETTAWARFQIGTGLSHGGPLPPVETPTDVVKQDTGRLGDFNGDGLINFADFLRFAAAFGKRLEATESEAVFDLDNDAEIGFQDFLIFASVFGK